MPSHHVQKRTRGRIPNRDKIVTKYVDMVKADSGIHKQDNNVLMQMAQ